MIIEYFHAISIKRHKNQNQKLVYVFKESNSFKN